MKKNLLSILLSFTITFSFSQTYQIDSLTVISTKGDIDKIIVKKYLEFYITNSYDKIEFKRNQELIYIFKKTSPKNYKGKVRFICYDKTFELLFFEIGENYIIESYKGLIKRYHIIKIYEK